MKNKLENIAEKFTFLKKKKFWQLLIIFGILLKLALLPYRAYPGDFSTFLEPWINFIKENGYFSALRYDFYNYSPAYIYILVMIAKIGLNSLFSIKIVSFLFEYLLAFFIGKIIYLKYKNKLFIWLSLAIVPLIPTLLVNSGYWGQCDSVYAAFAIGSIYFLLKKQPWMSALFFGLSFAFKMQVVFLLPFFFVMLLRNHIKIYHFLLVSAVYFLSLLPAWFAGRPLPELLTVYLSQTVHYQELTMNFPNIYIFISNDYYEMAKTIGLLVVFVLTLIFGLILSKKNIQFTFENWLQLAFLSVLTVPFLLPGMHERYMYLGDVLGIVYLFVLRRNMAIPPAVILLSFYAYLRCSYLNEILPMAPAFFLYLAVIVFLVYDFKKSLKYA